MGGTQSTGTINLVGLSVACCTGNVSTENGNGLGRERIHGEHCEMGSVLRVI